MTSDRGDVIELLADNGAAFATYRYDAWGNPIAAGTKTRTAGSVSATLAECIADLNVLPYAGYAFDAHSGMYYCSQRYYDPATMQFISKDVARADGEESAYQYCGGNPIGNTDPSGNFAQLAVAGLVIYYVCVALIVVAVAWYAIPQSVKNEWTRKVAASINTGMQKFPRNKYRWKIVRHAAHKTAPPLGGGFQSRQVWYLTHPDFRPHGHLDIFLDPNPKPVFHSMPF